MSTPEQIAKYAQEHGFNAYPVAGQVAIEIPSWCAETQTEWINELAIVRTFSECRAALGY